MSILLLIGGLILFIGLVVVHEWGHFIMARRSGVEVEEFAIGFPPRAKLLKRKNGTIYTLNWLPLGGYVKLKGEHDADTTTGSFGATSLANKVKIMTAGVLMNVIVAFLLLTFLALVGMPKLVDNQFTVARNTKIINSRVFITDIEPNSPAAKAGLKLRDRIDAISKTGLCLGDNSNNDPFCTLTEPAGFKPLDSVKSLQKVTKSLGGQNVGILVSRDNKLMIVSSGLRSKSEVDSYNQAHHCNDQNYSGDRACEGYLGVVPTEYSLQRSTWSAPIVAAGLMKQFTVLTFKGLWSAIKGLGSIVAGLVTNNHVARENGQTVSSQQVAGPVGIFVLLKDGSILGYQFILMIIAVISLTLAIMNILPIPALDGGRLFVTLLFHAFKKPLKARTEDLIQGVGFAVLLVLLVLVTVVDIHRR
ncbi:MAG TPA: M50 family metallopeptidase [Candidatus Saccharimonadales bacterium]|nr:M50 family metallopeptidase [Candidatus Saccharimonadales bacterium]